jgi:hypothetical protein
MKRQGMTTPAMKRETPMHRYQRIKHRLTAAFWRRVYRRPPRWLIRLICNPSRIEKRWPGLAPYTDIYEDGDLYMARRWIFNAYDPADVYNPGALSVRLHRIHRADNGRHLHNHPWHAITIILSGWYVEENAHGTRVTKAAGQTFAITPDFYHRIIEVSNPPPVTLFITEAKSGEWGFQTDDGFVPHEEYFRRSLQRQDNPVADKPTLENAVS